MLTEEKTQPFKPVQGIIVYNREQEYYLETHDIELVEKKFHWQEGKPFTKDALKGVAMALGNDSFEPMKIKGLLPDNLLYFKQTFFNHTLIWYLPPVKRKLHFTKELKIDAGEIWLPGLIFAVTQDSLYVVAYKGNTKPQIDTPLFKAPFYNIYQYAEVCMGDIKESKKKPVLQDEIQRWENRFFNSYFSHFLDSKVIKSGINLQLVYQQQLKHGSVFPEEHLVPSPYKKVEQFIKHIENVK